ncbi:MAG: glutamate--cysteine ligase, partial [Betaproteobacteria bacterium]|nr:glutamate--cysteine ligase [Betaproteobacteria bacterium]
MTGPLLELETRIVQNHQAIEHWFRAQWQEHVAPFYASVDLRNSGFKLVPVDTNLFPGGFNNLKADYLPLCVQALMSSVQKICPEAKGVLLIPENHTRNTFYLQNVVQIQSMLRLAGMRVRVGTLIPEIKSPTTLHLPSGDSL